MATYDIKVIEAAHEHSYSHYTEIQQSEICGCFHCLKVFTSIEVKEWFFDSDCKEKTAICPYCGIDSVIGSKSGYPVTVNNFLSEMCDYWFSAAS